MINEPSRRAPLSAFVRLTAASPSPRSVPVKVDRPMSVRRIVAASLAEPSWLERALWRIFGLRWPTRPAADDVIVMLGDRIVQRTILDCYPEFPAASAPVIRPGDDVRVRVDFKRAGWCDVTFFGTELES